MSGFFPSPVSLPPLGANLDVAVSLEFDLGMSQSDKAAKLAQALSIPYDQVIMQTHDMEATWRDNDISTPYKDDLVVIYAPMIDPKDAYVVGIVITCEMGAAVLYFCTDITTSDIFDPPDYHSMIPIPIMSGGCFVHVDDHDYEIANNWQGQPNIPIYIGEILAGAFLPTRLTSYIFLRTKGV